MYGKDGRDYIFIHASIGAVVSLDIYGMLPDFYSCTCRCNLADPEPLSHFFIFIYAPIDVP